MRSSDKNDTHRVSRYSLRDSENNSKVKIERTIPFADLCEEKKKRDLLFLLMDKKLLECGEELLRYNPGGKPVSEVAQVVQALSSLIPIKDVMKDQSL